MSDAILKKLNLEPVNIGACSGPGKWIREEGGEEIVSYNPTTGEAIASVVQAGEKAYEAVMDSAMKTFDVWRMMPAPKRGDVIYDLGNALREYKEPLGELVTLEMGKIRQEGLGEVQEMIDICDFAVGLSRQLYGLTMHSERPGHRMYEQWHPMGVIGIISAFNFPVAVWAWNAAIAGVCGDTMLWKPASDTPLTAVAVQHICNKVMGDHGLEGLFNIVIGPGSRIGERLINDPRLPLISFTGSTAMGRRVSERVASRFGSTILELGGNNAIIVTEHANVDMVVPAILFGAVGTAGQRCTSTRRIIGHKSMMKELADRLVKAYKQVRIGDPMEESTLMGPLVNEGAVKTMVDALGVIQEQGGEVLYGGGLLADKGKQFVEPTIVRMPGQTEIVKDETFAPILYLLEYENLDEALAIHNDVPQGLSSAIFTTNLLEAEAFLSHRGSDCGIANVNIGTSGAEIGGAFGGEKETGGGRESGSDAWKGYMRRQTNTIN
ncbi:MAG: L-piperidine-6-carboxylate dehydrogenase, partial [Planctomycetota bacterium]